MQKLAYATIAV